MEAKPPQVFEGMKATAGRDGVVRATTETIIGSECTELPHAVL